MVDFDQIFAFVFACVAFTVVVTLGLLAVAAVIAAISAVFIIPIGGLFFAFMWVLEYFGIIGGG